MKKILTILFLFGIVSNAFCAWNASQPTNTTKLKDTPALIRANWDAIALGTDAALLVNNTKIATNANIADTKLDTISTAGKVNGTAIVGLPNLVAGAGAVPIANGGTGASTATVALNALLPTETGNANKALITNGTVASWGYPSSITIASATTGDMLYYNGSAWVRLPVGTAGYLLQANGTGQAPFWSTLVNASVIGSGTMNTARLGSGTANNTTYLRGDSTWAPISKVQVFTSTGTFTAPADTSMVYLTMVGGGGGGGNVGGGGGGSGSMIFTRPYTVTPGNAYTVTIGDGGAGGAIGAQHAGSSGGTTSFNSAVSVAGGGGGNPSNGTGGGSSGWNGGAGSYPGGVGGSGYMAGGSGGAANGYAGGGGGNVFGSGADFRNGTVGGDATNYGTGGGGNTVNNVNYRGGNGAAGVCIVQY